MATALPLATDFTGATVTEAQLKTALTNQRAALAEIGDPLGRHGAIQNLSLAFSVAANALTCNVKTRAGAAPSATDPVSAAMRNATVATGDFNVRNITAALSLVISSGSTLGHLSATASFIYWYLIDNAGTLELAASTGYFGAKGIVTTVAEGGVGAADSATVMYSTTARSTVPFICVGRTTDTQTTAGTWTAVPTTVELAPLETLALDSAGRVFIGDTDNAQAIRASLTINEGAQSGEILCIKSTDVAHGITSFTETDTFFTIKQGTGGGGVASLVGYGEGSTAFSLIGRGVTVDTTKGTASVGPIQIMGQIKNGTSVTAVSANGNVVAVSDGTNVRFILDADGDSHQDVGTAWTNFDAFDDVALLDALSVAVSRDGDPIKRGFGEFLQYNREALERAKLVTFNEDGHHFVNMSKLTMALTGAVRQVGHALSQASARLSAMESRMLALEAKGQG